MDKTKRHQKATEFRRLITLPAQRMAQIRELLEKECFDESDQLRLLILFQKTDYINGCESDYRKLIAKINIVGDTQLINKSKPFANRLNA